MYLSVLTHKSSMHLNHETKANDMGSPMLTEEIEHEI